MTGTGYANADTVLEFVKCINSNDLDRISDVASEDHAMMYLDGTSDKGHDYIMEAWAGYCRAYPNYTVYVGV